MKLSVMQVLAADEIEALHEATLAILGNCGVKIGSPRMFAFLKERGLTVDSERQTVRFTRACIEDALAHIPNKFEVFNREGQHVFTLGDGIPRVAAGSGDMGFTGKFQGIAGYGAIHMAGRCISSACLVALRPSGTGKCLVLPDADHQSP